MDPNAGSGSKASATASRVLESVKSVARVQDSELQRWHKTFDANAKTVVDGEKYVLPPALVLGSSKFNSLLTGHLHPSSLSHTQ